jgi:hypothetical protein
MEKVCSKNLLFSKKFEIMRFLIRAPDMSRGTEPEGLDRRRGVVDANSSRFADDLAENMAYSSSRIDNY